MSKKPGRGSGWLLTLILVLGLMGCVSGFLWFRPAEPPQTELPAPALDATQSESVETTSASFTTLPPQTNEAPIEADPLAEYRYIFALYQRAVAEKWDFIACEENKICYMVMFHEDLSRLGYSLIDLNDDGQQELLISDGNVIYDLYASVDGSVMRVLTGGERNSFQLTDDHRIINRGSNGASSFVYNVYFWDGTKTANELSIFFDAMTETPWVVTRGDQQSASTEAESMALIESYQAIPIPIEPIP